MRGTPLYLTPSMWHGGRVTSVYDSFTLRGVTFPNRLWVPPMCMYSARDGFVADFHLAHVGARLLGGYGLFIAEATAVAPEGRISSGDLGLWDDAHTDGWARLAAFAHTTRGALGVQLGHAGRKASTYPMLPGLASASVPAAEGGWATVAPSAVASPGLAAPSELTLDEIRGIVEAFEASARRADEAGLDVVEIHAAHGYLLHQFLSPLSNHRTDEYGGSFEGRTRLVLEVVKAVRAVWPDSKPLFVRFSATDWLDGGWDFEQMVALAELLPALGVDLLDVSSGGLLPAKIDLRPGYQVDFAARLRQTGIPTAAVGLITEVAHADKIVADGFADAVLLGRESLRNPALPLASAAMFGVDPSDMTPPQYFRAW